MNGNLAYKLEPEEEVIGGRVVMLAAPGMRHIFVSGNLYRIFSGYLMGKSCTPVQDGAALYLDEGVEEYKPDMMVVCNPNKIKKKGVYGAPDLVVEVLSDSTARNDRGHKRDVYEKYGVREYWIVDPVRMSLEQYVLDGGKFHLREVYHYYSASEMKDMDDEERAAVVTEFRCGLFDDMTIRLEDVFYRVSSIL